MLAYPFVVGLEHQLTLRWYLLVLLSLRLACTYPSLQYHSSQHVLQLLDLGSQRIVSLV